MALGFVGLAKAFGEARKLDARGAAFLEREARLQEAARLAPELGLRAQPAKRGEKVRVAVSFEEPVLRALYACARFLDARFPQGVGIERRHPGWDDLEAKP